MAPNNGKDFVKTLHHDTYPTIDPRQWDMRGKVIAITGASRGIGKAMAVSYAQAGASGIVVIARSSTSLEDTSNAVHEAAKQCGREPPTVLQLVVDVTEQKSVDSAAHEIETMFNRIDILVNNAGFLETWKRVGDSDPDDWWTTFVVNVKGPYLVTKAMLPLLTRTQDGFKTIINVASVGAHVVTYGGSGYQMTKLALLRFTELLQTEYASECLLAIAIHPGGIPTDISAKLPDSLLPFIIDTLELAADATVWLTKERRAWLNGRYVDCCWDFAELEAKKEEIVDGDKLKVSLVV